MPIVSATVKRSESERKKNFRARTGDITRAKDREYKRKSRNYYTPKFIGVDSEGIGEGHSHRAVLLGVGATREGQYENVGGLGWQETFNHLYEQYKREPHAAYVGFYLGYDFNEWLKTLPENAAWRLLSPAGIASRRVPEKAGRFPGKTHYPVRVGGWEVDMLGFKRLSIRPMMCDCKDPKREKYLECEHKQAGNMHICDAGPFFQMPFIKVISPELWRNDPDGWPLTQEEYDIVAEGKSKRASGVLNDEMRMYNRLENELLARVMGRLAKGFERSGIKLRNDEWYGPGAAASKWLAMQPISKRKELEKKVPDWWLQLCKWSYYGGWFEIFAHGLMQGLSYNYDINNAYPYAISQLPCAECGTWSRGKGAIEGTPAKYTLVKATVTTLGDRIGAMPYRDRTGNILRPKVVRGWYWLDEIEASKRAGLVESVEVSEWAMYWPRACEHGDRPLKKVEAMYYERIRVGKASAQGLAIKLTNNSDYGKFAQSVGGAPYGNWFYATRITSACRIQILDAIATHSSGKESVLMVATDGICFDSPHSTLAVSKKLGEWDATEYEGLCLFKPGVYWHKQGKDAALKAKTRGVPAKEFVKHIGELEIAFYGWSFIPESRPIMTGGEGPGLQLNGRYRWPMIEIPVPFSMVSCREALNRGKWNLAAQVNREVKLVQSSDPDVKRGYPWYNEQKQRLETRIHDVEIIDTQPYKGPKILDDRFGFTPDGETIQAIGDTLGLLRGEPSRPDNETMEWTLVYG
jgi:hypothetical protein